LSNKLYFITGNEGKFKEIAAIIPNLEMLKLDLDEIQSLDPRAVIEHKLAQAAAQHDGEFIVEDTSLAFSCLNGFPGTLAKWLEVKIGVEGMAALVLKYEDRSATARVTIGYRSGNGQNHFFTGEQKGDIVAPRGTVNTFGWNSIFQPLGHDRTFAELTVEEKNHISMRGIAARKLASHLNS
jgi:non-canonical purine NTP pyrophosphatase (RdgB/HAM1 family)